MSLFRTPRPPDPTATANAQQQYNLNAARQTAAMNMVNQQTPFGSLTYQQTGTNPDGTPIFSATTALSPDQQALLNTQIGSQKVAGQTAQDLIKSVASQYAGAPDLGIDAMTKKVMGWGQSYLQPIFDMQQRALDAKLQNQGIAPGGENTAWDTAQRLQSRNVNEAYTNLLMQAEPLAFQQALTEYQLPLQTFQQLLGVGAPQMPTFQKTPTETVNPANYADLAMRNYQAQLGNQQNAMSGLGGIGSSLAGGWARSGFAMPSWLGSAGGAGAGAGAGAFADLLGAGGTAAASLFDAAPLALSFLSDERAKDDINQVGELFDGQPVFSFRYKGDPKTQIGLMAQEVEKVHPEAVGSFGGLKVVDYRKATADALMRKAA